MIIIGGLDVSPEDLPNSDFLDYEVAVEPAYLEIKLKTKLRSPNCEGACIVREWDHIEIPSGLEGKVVYFDTEAELISLLKSGDVFQSTDEPVDLPLDPKEEAALTSEREIIPAEPETPKPKATQPEPQPDPLPAVTLEGTNIQLPKISLEVVESPEDTEEFLEFPELKTLNIEDFSESLNTKDKIIEAKNRQIEELQRTLNEVYTSQEALLIELHQTHNNSLVEANRVINTMKEQISSINIPQDVAEFARFSPYAQTPLAYSKAEFTPEELSELETMRSSVHVLSCSPGSATFRYLSEVLELVKTGGSAVIVDLTGDPYLCVSVMKKTGLKGYSHHISRDEDKPLNEVFYNVQKSYLSFSRSFNDLTFLMTDWVKFLKHVDSVAMGLPIIVLFNSMNSFPVRYTVSKLATITKTKKAHIFTINRPFELISVRSDVSLLPADRVHLVSLDYLQRKETDILIEQFEKSYQANLFPQKVAWGKLGISV